MMGIYHEIREDLQTEINLIKKLNFEFFKILLSNDLCFFNIHPLNFMDLSDPVEIKN